MSRCTMKAFCLLSALAACVLLAQAAPNRRQSVHEGPGYYAHGGPSYEHEEHRYSEEYERRGDGPGYYHKEEHYDKVDVKTFVLQETSRVVDENTQIRTSHFKCSKEEDEPDFCLHPSYPDRRYYESKDPSNFIEDVLINDRTAECTWTSIPEMCPPHVMGGCVMGVMNCTISRAAAECGCPYSSGVVFRAKGFFTPLEALSCAEEYDPEADNTGGRRRLASADLAFELSNSTLYNGTAWVFHGRFDAVGTNEGVKEVKGDLEFVTQFASIAVPKPRLGDANKPHPPGSGPKAPAPPANKATKAKKQDYYPDGEEHHSGYYPEHEEGYGYGGYGGYGKPLIKGGSLKVTVVEAMHY